MNTNQDLFEMYKRELPGLRKALQGVNTVAKRVSYPQLVQVFPEYEDACIKLFVVGQQTKGWGWKSDAECWGTHKSHDNDEILIKELIKKYNGFHLGQSYVSTPFWRMAHNLYRKLNPSGPQYGFVWSNLVKVDQGRNRPERSISDAVCHAFPVLPYEIKITRPDVVVFLS